MLEEKKTYDHNRTRWLKSLSRKTLKKVNFKNDHMFMMG